MTESTVPPRGFRRFVHARTRLLIALGINALQVTGTATLDKATGNVLSFELTAPKAFKPAVVAKVDAFSMKVACKAAPDGRSHVDTFALQVSGTAMMKPFSQSETRKVSNLKAAPQSGYGAP